MLIYDLSQLHEDLVYVIECLLETYTGEAKSTLADIIESLETRPSLEILKRPKLIADITTFRESLFGVGVNRAEIIRIRRAVRNTIDQINVSRTVYAYVDPYSQESDRS